MDVFIWDSFQFRQPFFNVLTIRVIIKLLGPGIEYPEVWLSISTISYCPLPASTVLHCTEVYKLVREVSLTFVPIQEQILGEEGSSDHTASVVHESSCVQLSHSCVNDWKASFSLLPSIQMSIIVLPFDLIKLCLEGIILLTEHFGKMVANIDIEISPMKFIYQIILYSQLGKHCMVDFPNGDRSEMQIRRQSCGWNYRIISQLVVIFKLLDIAKNLQSVFSTTMNTNFIVNLIKLMNFLLIHALAQLLQRFHFFKMFTFKQERIWLGDFQLRKTVIFEGSEHQVRLLSLW